MKTKHGYASPLPTNAAASYPEVSLSAEAGFLAQQLQLPLNRHGNVDIRKGVPPGVCFLPGTASAAELRLAGIPVARALTGFGLEGRKYFPLWADAEVVPVGWDQQFKRWQETAEGAEILRRHREQLQKAADAKTAKRREAAQRAAATREEKRQLMASPLGQLMLILREAQKASDRAKRRAANGCRRSREALLVAAGEKESAGRLTAGAVSPGEDFAANDGGERNHIAPKMARPPHALGARRRPPGENTPRDSLLAKLSAGWNARSVPATGLLAAPWQASRSARPAPPSSLRATKRPAITSHRGAGGIRAPFSGSRA